MTSTLKLYDKVDVKIRPKRSKKVRIKEGKISQICDNFILVDYGYYRESYSLFELQQKNPVIYRNKKIIDFGVPKDVKKEELEKRKKIKNEVEDNKNETKNNGREVSELEQKEKLTKEVAARLLDEGKSPHEIALEYADVHGGHHKYPKAMMARWGLIKKQDKYKPKPKKKPELPTKQSKIRNINNHTKYDRHMEICEDLNQLYKDKNTAYGDAFSKTFKELGIISAVTRMSDKFNRVKSLALKAENNVMDENLKDTLQDLANYSIMTLIEMEMGGMSK